MMLLWSVFVAYHLLLGLAEEIAVETHMGQSSAGEGKASQLGAAEVANKKAADQYLIMANAFLKRGSTEGALKELKKAINRSPLYVDPYFIRGSVYLQVNDYVNALSDFITALEFSGGNHSSAFEYALEICNYFCSIAEYDSVLGPLGVLHSYDLFDEALGRLYADVLLQTGDRLGALAVLEKYPLDLSTKEAALLMASLYEGAGRS